MIPLSIQIELIFFSFGFGLFFFVVYFLCERFLYCENVYFRILNTGSLVLASTLLYFLGIEKISDGILHLYSLFLILLGFVCGEMIARRLKK